MRGRVAHFATALFSISDANIICVLSLHEIRSYKKYYSNRTQHNDYHLFVVFDNKEIWFCSVCAAQCGGMSFCRLNGAKRGCKLETIKHRSRDGQPDLGIKITVEVDYLAIKRRRREMHDYFVFVWPL